jgi:undecaprenyl-diphosphatase
LTAARRDWRPLVVGGGIGLVAFALVLKIADSVNESDLVVHIDHRVESFVLEHRTDALTTLARVVTQLGGGFVVTPVVVVTALVLLLHKRWPEAFVITASTAGAAVLVYIAKQVVGRARPPESQQLVNAHGLAFPSGHSAQSVACYGALAWIVWQSTTNRRIRVAACVGAVVIALAVGWSRIYLGVHWASDVVSGWLLGLGWLAVVIGLSSLIPRRDESPTP